ncbi:MULTISPECIES: bacteriocin immunity protein [Enterobacter]|uniref:bacteriocin immunity protein n=1 Tax=Enterobacter TaxID=547 RepID=UPI002F3E8A03
MEFVRSLLNVADTSKCIDIKNILEFKRLTQHPDGSDIIFYPRDDREDSPKGSCSRGLRMAQSQC